MYNKSMQAIPRSYVFKSFIQKRSFSIPQQWKGLARFKNPKVENNIVEKEKAIVIAMTPEGTRKKVSRWKTGFLRIAKLTKAKILLIAIDFPTKSIQIGDIFEPTGDAELDLDFIQNYYQSFKGINPEQS